MSDKYLPASVTVGAIAAAREAQIQAVEAVAMQMEQVDCPVVHHFGPGIYMREVSIKAGVFSIGHRQKCAHQNIMLKGRVLKFNDDGTRTELIAPLAFVSGPGRKVGLILEDMVWLNVYSTDETDIDKLEEMFLDKSETWKRSAEEKHLLETAQRETDRFDYFKVLDEVGISHETALAQSLDEADQMPMPPGYAVRVGASPIEGKGLFATVPFAAGAVIAPARMDGKRTPAGRYTNHSATPNARMELRRGGPDIDLIAIRPISGCKGGGQGDEITIDYREALALAGVVGMETA